MNKFIISYSNFITFHFRAILAFLAILISTMGYFAFHLDVDASAETLLLENDNILKITRDVHNRYKSPDSLIIAFSPKDDMLSPQTLNIIRNLKKEFTKLKGVDSVNTILDMPLLQSPNRSIQDTISDTKTLESKDINKTLAKQEFTTSPMYKDNLVSRDFKTTAILLNLKDDDKYIYLLNTRNALMDKEKAKTITNEESIKLERIKKEFKSYRDISRKNTHTLIEQIRFIIKKYDSSGELFLGGVMMIADDMISFIKDDIKVYGTSVILTMIVLLWIIFRQLRYVLIPISVAFFAVLITAGLYSIFGLEVTVISSNFVSMQLIMAISLSIHFIANYRENVINNYELSQQELISITLQKMFTPMAFVVFSSVVAYLSLLTSGILPVINFGWMMTVASSISFLFTIIFTPTILMILDKKYPIVTFDKFSTFTTKLANLTQSHPKAIYLSFAIIALFSIFELKNIIVENSFISYFKKDTEIYKGMTKIDKNLGGTTPLEVVIKFPKYSADATKNKISSDNNTLDSFEAEFKQQDSDRKYWFTSEKMDTILKVHNYLQSIDGVGNVLSLGTLLSVGKNINNNKSLDNVDLAFLYTNLSQQYKNTLLLPYVDIKNNEARFVMRIKDSSRNLDRDHLINIIENGLKQNIGLQDTQFEIVGMMVLYNNMLQSLYKTQILTVGETILLVGLMFMLLFRSWKVSLIAITVNIIPIGVVFGIMGVLDIPLDIMNITIAAIAFDMGLNNTVYYYLRFKSELAKDNDYTQSMYRSHKSIGNPMYYCSAVAILGFLVLVTSNFVPTVIFGLLIIVTIFVSIAADLLLSPLLIIAFKPFSETKNKLDQSH